MDTFVHWRIVVKRNYRVSKFSNLDTFSIVYVTHKSTGSLRSPRKIRVASLRKFAAIALVALSLVVGVGSVRAVPETPQVGKTLLTPLLSSILGTVSTVGDDTFSTMTLDPSTISPPPTQHYGPYASTSPDSGSCGQPDWANDAFNRFFSIFSQGGSLVVVEQFKDGSFTVPSTGPSPGACDNGSLYDGGIVDAGVTGNLHGYFIIPIPSAVMQTSADSHCDAATMTNAGCTTATFMKIQFTSCYPAVCQVTTFYDQYAAPGQGLIAHSWIDSSPDRAGEIGDIRSS